ncbi:olfactory receptor 6N1-like [Bombina bombina]|uniref:olfactory receptor 6N1-like n=1 Tax=Bombina bombina TaxID=8345 RepID=UPI00235A5F90|nr:olfactory receptor 6N1-like [Bombina bombina]
MENWNKSRVTEFILVGFPNLYSYGPILFLCLLLAYLLIIFGNVLIFITICLDTRLHIPMYFCVGVLSILELCYTAVVIPKMLINLLKPRKGIYFTNCLLQIYFFHSLGVSECYLLTTMAYDRYLAICHPLRYSSIMTAKLTIQLVCTCFIAGFLFPAPEVILISHLPYCGSNEIQHIFCDAPALLSVACTDKSVLVLIEFIVNSFILFGTFSFVMISYIRIIVAIMKINSSGGRSKAFSTCVSHLAVVLVFYSCTTFVYVRLRESYSLYYDRVLAVIYTVLTPIFNPIIYSLRNKEIRLAIKRRMCNRTGFSKSVHC